MSSTAPTYAEFIAAYPVFACVAQPAIERQLTFSSRLLDTPNWGDFYSDAVELDAAHNLAVDQAAEQAGAGGAFQTAAGALNSVSAAGVSISFGSGKPIDNDTDAWYTKTSYGQKFLRLRNVVITPGYMATNPLPLQGGNDVS